MQQPLAEQVPPHQINAWAWDEQGRTTPDGRPTAVATEHHVAQTPPPSQIVQPFSDVSQPPR
jgi:hypothetical protein